jgi:hypothetical protein
MQWIGDDVWRSDIFVMGVLTVVRVCFDVSEVVGVYALFLGSGTFGSRDLGWTPYRCRCSSNNYLIQKKLDATL